MFKLEAQDKRPLVNKPVTKCLDISEAGYKCVCLNVLLGGADIYMRDGLHLSGKGAAVFVDELPEAVESGMGSITICLVASIV